MTRYREIKLKTVIRYFSLLAILRYTTMLLMKTVKVVIYQVQKMHHPYK
jgi:hypothetical protein